MNQTSRMYAVIGDPIGHSLSPLIHNTLFREIRRDNLYIPLQIRPKQLGAAVNILRNNFAGFNVTIPHKEHIMEFLDEIDDQAHSLGAVNTVKNIDGRLVGYNTDGYGFRRGLADHMDKLRGKKALLLGAGGAARVVFHELMAAGCIVTVANRDLARAKQLVDTLTSSANSLLATAVAITEIPLNQYYLIVNTTPLGMSPNNDEMPIGEELVSQTSIVYDLIYNPAKTRLLATAEKHHCHTINGFPMLFYQAIGAEQIWLDSTFDNALVQQVYRQLTTGGVF